MNSKVSMGLRILFGLFCLVFGLNKFLNFMPFPPLPEVAQNLMDIYGESGFMKVIGVLEILGGVALVVNKYVPLALTFLVAIMFNAFLFHAFHDIANIGGAVVGLILSLILVFVNRERFSELLSA